MPSPRNREECVDIIRQFEVTLPEDHGRISLLSNLPDRDLALLTDHIAGNKLKFTFLAVSSYAAVIATGITVLTSHPASIAFGLAAAASGVGLLQAGKERRRICDAINMAISLNRK